MELFRWIIAVSLSISLMGVSFIFGTYIGYSIGIKRTLDLLRKKLEAGELFINGESQSETRPSVDGVEPTTGTISKESKESDQLWHL